MNAPDIKEVKSLLQARLEELCGQLLPQGRKEAGKWVSNNPITQDNGHKPALKVTLYGGEAGAWKDWRSGDGGDVIGLVAYLNGSDTKDHKFGYAWSVDWLGLKAMSRDERDKYAKQAAKTRERSKKQTERKRKRDLDQALALYRSAEESWHEWHMAGQGQLMPVQKHFAHYMAARNVAIDQIEHLDTYTFRFSSHSEWWQGAQWETINGRPQKKEDGPYYPAVHSAMRNHLGNITACHCTFLDPLYPQKAPCDPPKLMRGLALGSFISISNGASGELAYKSDRAGLVAVAEGIETALTIAEALPEARVWAAGSLAGFGRIPLDMPCVGEVMICRDNNHGNNQAQNQFENSLEKLEEYGKPVTVINSPVGDDFNDLAQHAGEDEDGEEK